MIARPAFLARSIMRASSKVIGVHKLIFTQNVQFVKLLMRFLVRLRCSIREVCLPSLCMVASALRGMIASNMFVLQHENASQPQLLCVFGSLWTVCCCVCACACASISA